MPGKTPAASQTDRVRRIGVILNGVTGRMGKNQHLIRSICAIRADGGIPLGNGVHLMPDPVLVGRDEGKLADLGAETGIDKWSTDLDACLADDRFEVYFDAVVTRLRPDNLARAIAAGKHVYSEKPTATSLHDALRLARAAHEAGVKTGVVQDKLFLPGIMKLKGLIDSGFFGRILSVRGDFGYWVFEGDHQPSQRPSWNYRAEDGGGIILDMLPHWRYLLDNLFGSVKSVMCLASTHVPRRWNEAGEPYEATADDAAYTLFELDGGIIAQINSSWCTRVHRDELVTFHVDGTEGSAVAGLRTCRVQHRATTPRPVWNPDIPSPIDFLDGWYVVPDNEEYENGFRAQWEQFLRHVAEGTPYAHTLLEAAKGVQLAALAHESWRQRQWIDVPDLEL